MPDSIQIRPAQPVDAEAAAALLYSAYTHTHVAYPLREEYESGFFERLQHFFRQDGNRFSYQNIQVAEYSSGVVGLVLSFGGKLRHGSTPPLEAGWDGRRRMMNGISMRLPFSNSGATKESVCIWCKQRSSRRASTTIRQLLYMSLKRIHRHWIYIYSCTM